MFNNTPVSSTAAQQQCQLYGGNLVSYMSLEEQQEVEGVFIERGDLVPSYHESYWLGLYSASVRPAQFNWADQLSGTLNWTHWGVYKWEGETAQEPNNLFGQENCGAANATQTHQDAFGWMDLNCNIRMPFMCRLISEWPTAAALPTGLPACLPALNAGSCPVSAALICLSSPAALWITPQLPRPACTQPMQHSPAAFVTLAPSPCRA